VERHITKEYRPKKPEIPVNLFRLRFSLLIQQEKRFSQMEKPKEHRKKRELGKEGALAWDPLSADLSS
jgi:hypothetical protein